MKLPLLCPSCENTLKVKLLHCENCHTEVSGLFPLPLIARLTADDQKFILDFVKASGSLKLMAQTMKLSYPTVRNRLDDIIQRIEQNENHDH